ncbi:MAG TPA: hypothetical protein VMS56_12205 [Thermoanaerobaculia bacterium]|nr:hypothetical protein [Thermoanaerobaculia bacterium]
MIRRRIVPILLAPLALVPFACMLVRGEVPSFRDHGSYFLPLRWHTAMALRAGELPLWNPWNGLGEPWLSNPQTAVFYPPAWIFLAMPFPAAYVLFLALHVAILGVGAYALFRRWAAPAAAAFGAVALMLSGPVFSLLDVNNNLASFAWFPIVIRLALERRDDRSRSVTPLGVALALMFLGGEPFYAAIAAAMVAIALLAGRDWRGTAGAGGWAAGLAAVQVLPFLSWISASDRTSGLDPGEAFRHSMAAGDWLAMVMSTASATGRFEPLRIEQQFIPSLYLGLPTVVLALAAGLGSLRTERPEKKRVLLVLLLSFAAILLLAAAPRLPLAADALLTLRFNAIRYPARVVPLGALLVAGLAAIGLERVRSEPLSWRLGITLSIVGLAGLRFLTSEPLDQPTTALRFGVFLAWSVVFGLVYVAFPRWIVERRGAAVLIVLLAADLLMATRPLLGSREHRTSVVWSERLGGESRFVFVRDRAGSGARAAETIGGYLNLYDRIFAFETAAPVVSREALAYVEAGMSGRRDDLIDLAAVRWILTDRSVLGPGYRFTGARREGIRLFENAGAFPQVWFSSRASEAADPVESAARLLAESFDPRSRLELHPSPESLSESPSEPPSEPGGLRLVRGRTPLFGPRRIVALIDAPARGWVVLAQQALGGWRVKVDGERRAILVANGMFVAVEVERGRRTIEWSWVPIPFIAGALVSAIAVSWLTLRSFFAWRMSRSLEQ